MMANLAAFLRERRSPCTLTFTSLAAEGCRVHRVKRADEREMWGDGRERDVRRRCEQHTCLARGARTAAA